MEINIQGFVAPLQKTPGTTLQVGSRSRDRSRVFINEWGVRFCLDISVVFPLFCFSLVSAALLEGRNESLAEYYLFLIRLLYLGVTGLCSFCLEDGIHQHGQVHKVNGIILSKICCYPRFPQVGTTMFSEYLDAVTPLHFQLQSL